MNNIKSIAFFPELRFSTSRSSGSGGQNVNKVSSKVTLEFDIMASALLSTEQKQLLFLKLRSRINRDGILQLTVQEDRSQHRNKELAIKKFYSLLEEAFHVRKRRVRTKASRNSKQKRLEGKRRRSDVKKLRKKGFNSE